MSSHLIDKVTLEIGLKRSRDAFDIQQDCSWLANHELLDIIENNCDRLLAKDERLVIERLQLDLGKLSAEDFKWQLEQRFKDEFSKQLKANYNQLLSSNDVPIDDSAFRTQEDKVQEQHINALNPDMQGGTRRTVEIITHFLTYGSLPWFCQADNFVGLNTLFDELIESDNQTLNTFKASLQSTERLYRLLNQLDYKLINRLYKKIFDTNNDWLIFFNNIENLITNISTTTYRIPISQHWKKIWTYSLVTPEVNSILSLWLEQLANDVPIPSNLFFDTLQHHQQRLSEDSKIDFGTLKNTIADIKSAKQLDEIESKNSTYNLIDEMELIEKGDSQYHRSLELETADLANDKSQADKGGAYSNSQHSSADKAKNVSVSEIHNKEQLELSNNTDQANNAETEISIPPSNQKTQSNSDDLSISIEKTNKGKDNADTIESVTAKDSAKIEPDPQVNRHLISNSGLVLFWPYLQVYFNDLHLLAKGEFKSERAHLKALHLLQYLATGEEKAEEHFLTLNKILCNWPLDKPVERFVNLSSREKQESNRLINAIIENWTILGQTSAENLRNTFLLRKGILTTNENGWLLRVEQGPYDMLIDKIPWGISMIKLSWMEQLLQVDWRYG